MRYIISFLLAILLVACEPVSHSEQHYKVHIKQHVIHKLDGLEYMYIMTSDAPHSRVAYYQTSVPTRSFASIPFRSAQGGKLPKEIEEELEQSDEVEEMEISDEASAAIESEVSTDSDTTSGDSSGDSGGGDSGGGE